MAVRSSQYSLLPSTFPYKSGGHSLDVSFSFLLFFYTSPAVGSPWGLLVEAVLFSSFSFVLCDQVSDTFSCFEVKPPRHPTWFKAPVARTPFDFLFFQTHETSETTRSLFPSPPVRNRSAPLSPRCSFPPLCRVRPFVPANAV